MYHIRLRLFFIFAIVISLAIDNTVLAQSSEHQLMVSVLNNSGDPVPSLEVNNFVVFEDNVLREILRVNQNTGPRQIAVLVDTSEAAGNAIRDYRLGLSAFINTMHDDNNISIVSYGGPPRILVESTRVHSKLETGIGKIFSWPTSASYLLDAMSETTIGFLKRGAHRPVMVVLTVQGPDFSSVDGVTVVKRLKEAGVSLYAVVLTEGNINQRFSLKSLNGQIEREIALNRGSSETGGRRLNLLLSTSVEQRLLEVATELQNQYLITYSSPNTLIPPKNISVRVRREGVVTNHTPIKIIN